MDAPYIDQKLWPISLYYRNFEVIVFVERWENLSFCSRLVYMTLKSVTWITPYQTEDQD